MKKISIVCALIFFLISVVVSPCMAQDAQDILAKMVEAQGGKATLEKIKDTTITGTMEMVTMGISGTMTVYQKEPNKMRMDMEIMGMTITQAFDGENAWWVNPQTGSIEDLPDTQANEVKRMAMGYDSILHPEKFGITYTYKGKETIEGKDYLVLEQTFEDGFKTTNYVDTETYFLYKSTGLSANQAGIEVDTETFYGDYKKADGVTVSHNIRIVQEGEEAMIMTFTEVVFNTGLEDSLFEKEE
jgi:outer membrane lipoprotein-sorting protein